MKTSKEMSNEIEEEINNERIQKLTPEKTMQRIERNTITIIILLLCIVALLLVNKLDIASIRETIREFILKTFRL